jgi:hypothetical protein
MKPDTSIAISPRNRAVKITIPPILPQQNLTNEDTLGCLNQALELVHLGVDAVRYATAESPKELRDYAWEIDLLTRRIGVQSKTLQVPYFEGHQHGESDVDREHMKIELTTCIGEQAAQNFLLGAIHILTGIAVHHTSTRSLAKSHGETERLSIELMRDLWDSVQEAVFLIQRRASR